MRILAWLLLACILLIAIAVGCGNKPDKPKGKDHYYVDPRLGTRPPRTIVEPYPSQEFASTAPEYCPTPSETCLECHP